MIAPATDPVGIESVESLARFGFDYVELSLSHLTALAEPAFAQLKARLHAAGLPCEACNNFFPPQVRLTGPEARLPVAMEYAKRALERAAALGARIIVFGSSGAKNVPPGFPKEAAWQQLVALLEHLGPLAAQHHLTIAIEPLNRQESNIVNLAAEGLQLAREVNHPNIQLLIDYYHLMMEQEGLEVIPLAGPALRHLHLAQVAGRAFPREDGEGFAGFFDALRQAGYQGRCSIEAYTRDFQTDAPHALGLLKTFASKRIASH